jgi:hypothetical protein
MRFIHTPLAHNPVQRRRLRAAQTAITSELSYCSGIHRFPGRLQDIRDECSEQRPRSRRALAPARLVHIERAHGAEAIDQRLGACEPARVAPEHQLAENVRPAGINSYISTSQQRGVDGIDNEIQAWLAGTKWLRQERA